MTTDRRTVRHQDAITVGRRRRVPYAQVRVHISRDSSLSILARHLYTLLCGYADVDGQARPSAKRLEAELGVSEKTRKRAVTELVRAGYLEVLVRTDERGKQLPNLYVLLDDFGIVDDPTQRIPARRGSDRGVTHDPPHGGVTHDPGEGVTHDPGRGSPTTPSLGGSPMTPSYEQPDEQTRARRIDALRGAARTAVAHAASIPSGHAPMSGDADGS